MKMSELLPLNKGTDIGLLNVSFVLPDAAQGAAPTAPKVAVKRTVSGGDP